MCDRLLESRPSIGGAATIWWMSRFSAALLALSFTTTAIAQDGMFDLNWGAGGRLQIDRLTHYSSSDQGGRLLIQSDGNLLIGGQCYDAIGGAPFCAARLHPDGSYDTSFGANGTRIYDALPDAAMFALVAASGNKALLAGETFGGEASSLASFPMARWIRARAREPAIWRSNFSCPPPACL